MGPVTQSPSQDHVYAIVEECSTASSSPRGSLDCSSMAHSRAPSPYMKDSRTPIWERIKNFGRHKPGSSSESAGQGLAGGQKSRFKSAFSSLGNGLKNPVVPWRKAGTSASSPLANETGSSATRPKSRKSRLAWIPGRDKDDTKTASVYCKIVQALLHKSVSKNRIREAAKAMTKVSAAKVMEIIEAVSPGAEFNITRQEIGDGLFATAKKAATAVVLIETDPPQTATFKLGKGGAWKRIDGGGKQSLEDFLKTLSWTYASGSLDVEVVNITRPPKTQPVLEVNTEVPQSQQSPPPANGRRGEALLKAADELFERQEYARCEGKYKDALTMYMPLDKESSWDKDTILDIYDKLASVQKERDDMFGYAATLEAKVDFCKKFIETETDVQRKERFLENIVDSSKALATLYGDERSDDAVNVLNTAESFLLLHSTVNGPDGRRDGLWDMKKALKDARAPSNRSNDEVLGGWSKKINELRARSNVDAAKTACMTALKNFNKMNPATVSRTVASDLAQAVVDTMAEWRGGDEDRINALGDVVNINEKLAETEKEPALRQDQWEIVSKIGNEVGRYHFKNGNIDTARRFLEKSEKAYAELPPKLKVTQCCAQTSSLIARCIEKRVSGQLTDDQKQAVQKLDEKATNIIEIIILATTTKDDPERAEKRADMLLECSYPERALQQYQLALDKTPADDLKRQRVLLTNIVTCQKSLNHPDLLKTQQKCISVLERLVEDSTQGTKESREDWVVELFVMRLDVADRLPRLTPSDLDEVARHLWNAKSDCEKANSNFHEIGAYVVVLYKLLEAVKQGAKLPEGTPPLDEKQLEERINGYREALDSRQQEIFMNLCPNVSA